MPFAAKTRTASTRTARAASATKPSKSSSTLSSDDLAEKLATKLTISDFKGKAKDVITTSHEREAAAMRAVNLASKSLSVVAESGWKASQAKADRTTAATAVKDAAIARKELAVLRELSPGEVDIERAASSIAGKLIALEMYQAASGVLQDMRAPLVAFYTQARLPISPHIHDLLSLPLYDGPVSEVHLTLISTYFLHTLTVALHITTDLSAFLTLLHDPTLPTLLAWAPAFLRLPDRQQDHLFTRAYTLTSRFASSIGEDACSAYSLRIYSLLCLAHTRPSVIAPQTFWDQLTKSTAAFASADSVKPTEGVKTVLRYTARLLTAVEKRQDRAAFMSGPAFARFCEYWSRFAKQAGDLQTLDRISKFAQDASRHADAGQDRTIIETSALCTTLARIVAILETWSDRIGSLADELNEAPSAIARCRPSLVQSGDDHDRVKRGLEKIRRAVVSIIEPSTSTDADIPPAVQTCARSILEQVVDVLCEKREHYTSTSVTGAVEGLFTLARTTFVINNAGSYAPTRTYLQRAAAFVSDAALQAQSPNADKSRPLPFSSLQLANYKRCVAGVYYNFAVQLHQNGRLSHAVPFLTEACNLSDRALVDYRTALLKEESADEIGKREVWRQLEEQLYRRWELLGVCHAKTGDRQLAYDAFVRSIKAFPYAIHEVAELAAKTPPSTLFDSAPPLKHLAALVDRVTYMGTCELFLAPESIPVSAWQGFAALVEDDLQRSSILGVLMERQLASLEECRWKSGVKEALDAITSEAEVLYQQAGCTVRRTRVLVRKLEMRYHDGGGDNHYAVVKQLGEKIQSLLTVEDINHDAALVRFIPEFLASTHLWLAAHAHKARDSELCPAILSHVEDACRVLKGMVPPAVGRQSAGQPTQHRKADDSRKAHEGRKGVRTPRGATTRLPAACITTMKAKAAGTRARGGKGTAARAPVTPRKRKVLEPVSFNTAIVSPPKHGASAANLQGQMDFDDFGRLTKLIRMVSHVVGLVGDVLARIQLLNIARRLTERHVGAASEVYVSLAIDTAHEYVRLGRGEKAATLLMHVLPAIRNDTFPQEIVVLFMLRYAEAQARIGDVLKASMTYCDAVATAANCVEEEKGLPTAQRIRVRTALLQRAAEAALAFAAIQDARDDPASSLRGLLQALRLWNRAIDTLSRLQPSTSKPMPEDNPFEMPKHSTEEKVVAQAQEIRVLSTQASRVQAFLDSSGWRLAEGLLSTLLALSQAYAARGSAREAEFFAQQTRELAQSLHAPVMVSRALAQQGDLQIQLCQLQAGHASLMEAAALVMHLKGPDAAEIRRLQGRYSQLSADRKGARLLYEEAMSLLNELGSIFAGMDGTNSARTSAVSLPRAVNPQTFIPESILAPTLLARLLRYHISLLHEVGEEYSDLLQRFAALPQAPDAKAEEIALRAKLTLDEVYSRFRADMFLSSLAESAMTIPMGMSGEISPSAASQDMLETLATAERLFWEHMSYIARRGHVSSVREAAVCLALIRTFRTSLGRGDLQTPVLAAQLLDASTATTLRREMLDVVRHKFLDVNAMDDLQWPLITPNGSPLAAQPESTPLTRFGRPLSSDSEDDEPVDDEDLKTYWESIAKRYEAQCFDMARMSIHQADQLPPHWTVITVSVTQDRHTMFITRQRAARKPLIFCLPLKGRREGQEDEHLTYDDAINELQDIIRLSDEGTRQAANVKKDDRSERMAWWKTRSELDTRLRELLADIEYCWLGAFKTIFTPTRDVSEHDLAALRSRLDGVFKGSLVFQDKKPKSRIGLDDGLLECFSTLPPNCRDEELEDLVYFILDLYQFHGVPVAISEVEMDQVVVELRNALEEHAARLSNRASHEDDDGHIFLVLDKNVQGIPWESLPVLRGKSVSRIPSMDFLLDRLEFSHWRKWQDGPTQEGLVDHATIDPRRTYFVLNPSGDLKGTEGRFANWLKEMKRVGWDGIIGHAPSEQQFVDALTNRDLMIYFGHGGAEQYIRSHKIRHLPRCAATMLWGCSSGVLKYMGEFDRTGTPYHYMLAGCPTLIANLWDVTDRDIDKFSQSVFDDLRLNAEAVKKWQAQDTRSGGTSVVRAVAKARESCKLRYLTGAAPVVYGIPFYL
ncbi:peptidase family C50-domain-containing protein [Trametes punicea]|nr:peptidase family C50-domain-containing protein [Trametes punicea]